MSKKSTIPKNKKGTAETKSAVISRGITWWRSRKLFQKICLVLLAALLLIVSSSYGISYWYLKKHQSEPLVIGTSFSFKYARDLGIDPYAAYEALIKDVGIKRFRLMSYWDQHEQQRGVYNFDELDWQFQLAEENDVDISLAIGLRQPRWPECHWPTWAQELPYEEWKEELKDYIQVVIERYKDSPSLVEYQLENEFFLSVFGECPDFSRDRLIDEYEFVKSLDNTRPVVISRSNNAVGLPIGDPRPDKFAVSVYKRVWDKTITKDYFEYPFPPWFYGFLAGAGEIVTDRDMFIHELQAEPWGPTQTKYLSKEEQDKSMDAERLRKRIQYGIDTGMRTIDVWGSEWYYWRKTKFDDPSVWNVFREFVKNAELENRSK